MSSCTNPLLAVRLYDPQVGSGKIKILPRRVDMGFDEYANRYGRKNMLLLPCGHCLACISRRKKEWSVRCALEALDHEKNCFVTLTYDDNHLVNSFGELKKDLLRFIKAIRNAGYQVRYFGCGERGERKKRLHGHIILFGYFPDDIKSYALSQKNVHQFESPFLTKLWNKGIVTVEHFSPYAASYVAGYVLKKMTDKDESFHFQSTRPGIGAYYALRNMESIYDEGKLILNFGSHLFAVPRYFDKLAVALDMDLSDIKATRQEACNAFIFQKMRERGLTNSDQSLLYDEQLNFNKIRFEKRGN